ncbi:Transcriptional regulator [Paenibacillus pasadenensis]|uniref:Transcriptional regulator n=1 Tax=Paenibacillus pasadenensis TaxID=217090 RepID=A0A2N5N882_9BACL|nr:MULTISPECIES: LCP family protein [Paenibacillus]PLT46509.1 Transcriptional regulator [Paenibacillus pasadenensis]
MNRGNEYPARGQGKSGAPAGSRKGRPGRRKPKRVYWLRRLMTLLALVLLAGAGFAAYLLYDANKALGQISSGAPAVPSAGSVRTQPTAMLLMGLDTRGENGLLNTDVLMAAAFNPRTKSAVVVSIPRDARVPVQGYKQRKVNSYYAAFIANARSKNKDLSREEAERQGKLGMKDAIGSYLDIPIDYAATINFQGFADVVDALGGVEVDVDMDMDYDDHAGQPGGTSIHLKKGAQKLYGEDALGFVRYRKSNDGTNMSSDFERNQRQEQVIGAMTSRLKSVPGILRLGKVFGAVGDNMRTDMPESEIRAMLMAYFGIGGGDIEFIALTGDWRSPYVYVDDASLAKAKKALQAKLGE